MPSWSIVLPLLAALLGAGVSAGGSYLAARRQHNLGILHDLYRQDLPELSSHINTALTQVTPPMQGSFTTREFVDVAKRAARKAATGSRQDRTLARRLHELGEHADREHQRLVQQYGKNWDQKVPQTYEGGYFQEAPKLLRKFQSEVETLDGELERRIWGAPIRDCAKPW